MTAATPPRRCWQCCSSSGPGGGSSARRPIASRRSSSIIWAGGVVDKVPRNARVEAARLAGGAVVPLGELKAAELDALLIPGGAGAMTTLSDYADKHELCAVDPDLSKLLRALLPAHRPMGFIGMAALLAARVLGPVSGVRITLGTKAMAPSKHAAIMGRRRQGRHRRRRDQRSEGPRPHHPGLPGRGGHAPGGGARDRSARSHDVQRRARQTALGATDPARGSA